MKTFGSLFLIYLLLLFVPISALAGSKPGEESSFFVLVKDRLLTVKVRDIPVKKALTEIANQAQIKILFYGSAEDLLSADFSDIPLDKGVKRLTAHSNYAFIYGPKKAKRAEPTMITPEQPAPEEQEEAIMVSLSKALEDKDPVVREETVYLLSEFEDERVVGHLTEILLNDEDKAVRASAAEELGDFGDQTAIDPLIKALEDNDARVRESVLEALGLIGGKRVISKLMEALRAEDEDVRDAAAEALGDINERLRISTTH